MMIDIVLIVAAISGPVVYLIVQYCCHERAAVGEGKVVVITGASSGLGRACAEEFYKLGCDLALCSRDREKLVSAKKELLSLKTSYKTTEPKIVSLDLSDPKSIESAAEKINEIFPEGVHVLVNNAGISYRGDIAGTSMDVFRKVMETNFFGQVFFTKLLLPALMKVKLDESNKCKTRAHIVSVNSVQGNISIPHRSCYSTSKFASKAFFDCLRSEVAEFGIRICNVYPAYIQTNLSVNAVTADGSYHNKLDPTTASGMKPRVVAREIMEAIRLNKDELFLVDLKSRVAMWLRNFSPTLYFWYMKKRAKRENMKMK